MFDHLLQIEEEPNARLTPLAKAAPEDLLSAQVATADWLDQLGVPSDEELDEAMQRRAARTAFQAVVLEPDAAPAEQREALVQVKTPEAVRHLVGMLSAYDWEFVEQAKELRGYVVAKIVEETKHPDARIRLKALQMLGNVTEVAAFTERVEVKKTDANEQEVNEKLRAKLEALLNPTKLIEVAATPAPPAPPTEAP